MGSPSDRRTRWPSTSQPGRDGASAAATRRARPASSGSTSTGTPATASSARARSSRRRPWSPGTSQATAVWGRSPRMAPTSLVSTPPGPASTNTRAPAAYMASISSTNRTGLASWRARASRRSGPWGAAVVFDHTGKAGSATSTPASTTRNVSAARATTGLWKAHATGSRFEGRPAAVRRATASARAGSVPEITVCRGELWLATHDPVDAGDGGGHVVGGGGHRGHPARVGAGRVEDGRGPGRAQAEEVVGGDGAGRGQGHQLAVAVAGGQVGPHADRGQHLVHGQAGDAEGGLGRPGVGDGRLLGRLVVAGEGQGREHHRGVASAGQAQEPLQAGEGDEQVGQHPRPLAALAGEQERDLPGVGRVGRGRRRRRRRNTPSPAVPARSAVDLGRQVVEVVGDARAASAPGPAPARPRRSVDGAGAGRAARHGRPAPVVGRPMAAMSRPGGRRRPAPRRRNSSAGHSSQAVGRLGRPVVAGQDGVEVGAAEAERAHPGVRSPGAAGHGRAPGEKTKGLVAGPSRGWAR